MREDVAYMYVMSFLIGGEFATERKRPMGWKGSRFRTNYRFYARYLSLRRSNIILLLQVCIVKHRFTRSWQEIGSFAIPPDWFPVELAVAWKHYCHSLNTIFLPIIGLSVLTIIAAHFVTIDLANGLCLRQHGAVLGAILQPIWVYTFRLEQTKTTFILQMYFTWKKPFLYWWKFYWFGLLPKVPLTISQHYCTIWLGDE